MGIQLPSSSDETVNVREFGSLNRQRYVADNVWERIVADLKRVDYAATVS